MQLTKQELREIHGTLLQTFDSNSLQMMVRIELGERLETIAGGDDLNTVIFNLITWAERTHRVDDLIRGAAAFNPDHPALQRLLTMAGRWEPRPLDVPSLRVTAGSLGPPDRPTPELAREPHPKVTRRGVSPIVVLVAVTLLGAAGIFTYYLLPSLGFAPGTNPGGARPPVRATATSPAAALPVVTPPGQNAPTFTAIPLLPSLTVNQDANLRTGPSVDYPIAGYAQAGDRYTILGRDTSGTWIQIEVDDTPVWILAGLATTSNVDQVSTVQVGAASALEPALVVNVELANARAGPGTQYGVAGIVQKGEAYRIQARNSAGDWYQIDLNGSPAWLSSGTVTASHVELAPVVNDPGSP